MSTKRRSLLFLSIGGAKLVDVRRFLFILSRLFTSKTIVRSISISSRENISSYISRLVSRFKGK